MTRRLITYYYKMRKKRIRVKGRLYLEEIFLSIFDAFLKLTQKRDAFGLQKHQKLTKK